MKLNQSVQCLISIAKNHVLVCFGIVFGQNQGELPAMLLYCNLLQSYGKRPTYKKRFPIDMVISNTGSDVRVPKGTRMSRSFYHELCCATGCSSPFRAGHSQLLTTRFLVVR